MTKYLLILLLLVSCGSPKYLPKETVETERSHVVSYYNSRSTGFPFQSSFYRSTDSSFALYPQSDGAMGLIYIAIQGQRRIDSTGIIEAENGNVAVSNGYWGFTAKNLDLYFKQALAGRK